MARPTSYGPDEPTQMLGSKIRIITREEVAAIAEEQGRTMARVAADAIELYVAAIRGDEFEPRVLGPNTNLQLDLIAS